MFKLAKNCLSYDDVLLQPQYSDIRSRSEIDISTDLGKGLELSIPLMSSPMDTISEGPMAAALSTAGGVSVIHRYNSPATQARIVTMTQDVASNANHKLKIGAAVGISGDFLERAHVLLSVGVDFLCIDVAHGHHIMMKEALKNLRDTFGNNVHIMAGNVATLQGVNDLADWGADSVRCNIGGGSICSTRVQTGHGYPGLQTIFECAQTDRDVKIIADGGIKTSGDMVKALAAGSDAVMIGSLLSGTDESPGSIMEDKEGQRWKIYRGMASKEAQIGWRGKYSSHEGISTRVPYRGSVRKILDDLERGIRSGFSYSGARSLQELQQKAEFVGQTASGIVESQAHIVGRKW
jgi:IMP dehydrogenase